MYRGCIAFAIYSNSQTTMDIMLPSPGLEEPSSVQSHELPNRVKKINIKQTTMAFRLDHRLMTFIFVRPIVGEPTIYETKTVSGCCENVVKDRNTRDYLT